MNIIARMVLTACLAAFASRPAGAQGRQYETVKLADGSAMKYALVLPDGFEATKEYPVLLALPPGAQDLAMVEEGLRRYWEAEGKRRGWIIVSPAAPKDTDFAQADPSLLAPLVSVIDKSYRVKGGRMHLAGVSNGGRAAMHIAKGRPEWFSAVLVLPGCLSTADEQGLDAMRRVRVAMLVGQKDEDTWVQCGRKTERLLTKAGVTATLEVLPGQGHVLDVPGEKLFGLLDGSVTSPTGEDGMEAVKRTLDDFHDAAAKADEARYFSHFTPDAVFIGTDANERWTKGEFQKWAAPYFARGTAWAYTPRDRHVFVSADGNTAWFDEFVDNAKLGACRGTGVLVREGNIWRIAQYHLVIPVPNELSDELVTRVRALEAKRPKENPKKK